MAKSERAAASIRPLRSSQDDLRCGMVGMLLARNIPVKIFITNK